MEKRSLNVISATLCFLEKEILPSTSRHILEKSPSNVNNAILNFLGNYSSSQSSPLNSHKKTHSGEKPNKCNQCKYASRDVGDLIRHVRIHSGEKPHKCDRCNFSFSRARHNRTHRESETDLWLNTEN